MGVLDQSHDLIWRSAELKTRSARMRAAAGKKVEKSARLIAAAAETREAMMRALREEAASGADGTVSEGGLPGQADGSGHADPGRA